MVQRNTQTVRAHVPRTGEQKWNFSVSLHDVAFHPAVDPCQPLDEEDDEDRQGVLVDDLSEVVAEDVVLKAGLGKTRFLKKKQSSGFLVFWGFLRIFGFFLYECRFYFFLKYS